jgi:hypothetical protein
MKARSVFLVHAIELVLFALLIQVVLLILFASVAHGAAPYIGPVTNMTVAAGDTARQSLTATDPDGEPLQFQMVAGPPYMTVRTLDPGTGTAKGEVVLAPGFAAAGPAEGAVRASDGMFASDTRRFSIIVTNVNRNPVPRPGGPYCGTPGAPILFRGGESWDPDGDALSFVWDFGDLTSGTGPEPSHSYSTMGEYAVSLTVSDGVTSATASTRVEVSDALSCRAFSSGSARVIQLGSTSAVWSIQLEPVAHNYGNASVDLSSICMKSEGTGSTSEIDALSGKTWIVNDTDGNGEGEITAAFAQADLANLFANVTNPATVPVTFEGRLVSGGMFRGQADIGVQPATPVGSTAVAKVYDVSGRLVRSMPVTILTGPTRVSLDHDHVRALASGIYFLKIDSPAWPTTRRVVVLK